MHRMRCALVQKLTVRALAVRGDFRAQSGRSIDSG